MEVFGGPSTAGVRLLTPPDALQTAVFDMTEQDDEDERYEDVSRVWMVTQLDPESPMSSDDEWKMEDEHKEDTCDVFHECEEEEDI